jgi:hypothetical protein
MEKAAVRTSTEATFVLTRIVPSNHEPGSIFSVDSQMRTMRGGAFGVATGGDGQTSGGFSETMRFSGTDSGFGEQPETNAAIAPARSVKRMVRDARRGA